MSKVKSFEFKKDVRLFYRYNEKGDIEVLYEKKWITLKSFVSNKYTKVKAYNK